MRSGSIASPPRRLRSRAPAPRGAGRASCSRPASPAAELAGLPRAGGQGPRRRRRAGAADLRDRRTARRAGARPDRARDGGNPLALTELPRGLTPAQVAGGFGLPHVLGLSGRIEDSFLRRLDELPADTRRLLLVAASDSVGDTALVWQAAERLGIDREAAQPAHAAGLLEFGATVWFRHPLVRSAVYRPRRPRTAAPRIARSRRHRSRRRPGPPRVASRPRHRRAGRGRRGRARTLGRPRAGPGRLRRGGRVPGAGGTADADLELRAERGLDAAEAMLRAGAFDVSRSLLAAAAAGPLDEVGRARTELLSGRIGSRSSAAATRPRSCWRRPRLEPRTSRSRATPTSMRSSPPRSPTASSPAATRARSPRRPAARRPRRPRSAPSTCCSTGSPCSVTEGTSRPPRARAGAHRLPAR